jgi:hypothetical protein
LSKAKINWDAAWEVRDSIALCTSLTTGEVSTLSDDDIRDFNDAIWAMKQHAPFIEKMNKVAKERFKNKQRSK